MAVLTRDQIKAYQDQIPNRGRWQYYRTASVIDNLVRDMADSFALLSEVAGDGADGVPMELESFAAYGVSQDATTTITSTGATDLQTAIDAASDGDIIEVTTGATYDPIVLPADKGVILRGAFGYTPKISGQYGVTISDDTRDCLIARIQFPACSTAAQNEKGAAVALEHQGIFEKVVFYQCAFPEVTNGSAVMVSYHQSIGGDNYATSPVYPTEFSTKLGFIECNLYGACKDGIEGAAIAARGVNWFYVRGCHANGAAINSRGVSAQVCRNAWIEGNRLHNFGSGNSEGIKFDRIGSTTDLTTGLALNNTCYDCVEGIDVDDYAAITVLGNHCYNCSDEGISVDGDGSTALIVGNITHNCTDGIRAESGAVVDLRDNSSFANSSNDYRMDNGYTPDSSNWTSPRDLGPAAALLPYYPTTPGDWTSTPGTIKEALDELASTGGGGSSWTTGSSTFTDDTTTNIDLGASTSVRRILMEYHMDNGTYQEHGQIGIGCDGTNASSEVVRQGTSDDNLVESITISADVSGGQVRLNLVASGSGTSVTIRYAYQATVTT